MASLPVARFHGIGPVTARKMERLGIVTGADLREWSLAALQAQLRQLRRLVLAYLPRDRRARGQARPAVQIGQRRAHLRRGFARSRPPRRRARADLGLRLGSDRTRRSRRPDRDSQGQIWRFHLDHALEELRCSSARYRGLHRGGASAARRPCIPCPRGSGCLASACITYVKLGKTNRLSWDWRFDASRDIKLSSRGRRHSAVALKL